MESKPALVTHLPSMIERHAHTTHEKRLHALEKNYKDLPPLAQQALATIKKPFSPETAKKIDHIITAAEGLTDAYQTCSTLADKHLPLEAARVAYECGDTLLAEQYFDFCIPQYIREDLFILPDNTVDSELFWGLLQTFQRTDIIKKAVTTLAEDIANELKDPDTFDTQSDTHISKSNGFLALSYLQDTTVFFTFYTQSIQPYLERFPNDSEFRAQAIALCNAYNYPAFAQALSLEEKTSLHTSPQPPVPPQHPTIASLRRTLGTASAVMESVSTEGTNTNTGSPGIDKITAEKNFARTAIQLAEKSAEVLQKS